MPAGKTGRLTSGGEGPDALPVPVPVPVAPGRPPVQVLMPVSTPAGVDEQPGEMVGYGAIPAGSAREVAADATLRRLVFDPRSGALLDCGSTVYRPPVALADHVRARDDGRIEWITPTGHSYTSEPFDHRLDDDPFPIPPGPQRSPPPPSPPVEAATEEGPPPF
jgi:hypothetical protein